MTIKNMKIPLYHGTSSLFLDSIKNEGLGKINIVNKHDLITPLNEIYQILKNSIEHWKRNGWYVENMINQKTSRASNWQHGQVYLSPSLQKAPSYAQSNNYGSEFVSQIIRMYNELKKNNLNYVMQNDYINSILDKVYDPIVIKVSNLPISILECEAGLSINEQIDIINQSLDIETECQMLNFRLISPVFSEQYEIIYL